MTCVLLLVQNSFLLCRIRVLQNPIDRGVDGLPLFQQLAKNLLSFAREPIEPLVALFFLAPLAHQQPLCLQPAEQRVKRALINLQASFDKLFPQGVAIVLCRNCARTARVRQPRRSSSRRFSKMFSFGLMLCLVHCTSHTV